MNLLTFDIEDWFHTHENRKYYSGHIWESLPARVEENTKRLLDVLDEYNRKATFFVLGWVAEKHPELIKQIHHKGHEIAAHSHWHHNARLLSPEDFEKDLKRNIHSLENIIGEKVIMYRAPGYSLKLKSKWAFEILANNGISIDSSIQLHKSGYNAPFRLKTNNSSIIEFPLLKTRFGFPYSGGGFFRVLPESILLDYFEKSDYNLLYLHPRDIDHENPGSNIFSAFRNWFNGHNTETTLNKLSLILDHHKTMTMGEAAIATKMEK